MKVFFTDAARAESFEAFDFYQQHSRKAAANFLRCLEDSTKWLTAHPTTGKPLSARTRRYLMKTFPFLVIYRVTEETVWIVGVVHEKRDPETWRHLI